jgi:hypothetical protein
LCGEWALKRSLVSDLAGQSGQFEGRAWFTQGADDVLAYLERGVLRPAGGGALQAERRYLWRADAHGVAVQFEDGRAFHSFSFTQTQDSHFCDPDLYNVTYDFSQWPRWSSQWRVTGPRKDYTSFTTYARGAPAPL